MEEESIHYVDSTLTVTSDGVYLHDRRYTLDAIDSVQIRTYNTARKLWSLVVSRAALAAFMVYFLYLLWEDYPYPITICNAITLSLLVLFIGAVVFIVFPLFKERYLPVYVVLLYGPFGYSKIAASVDYDRARRIATVIESARDQMLNSDCSLNEPAVPYEYPPGVVARAATARYADDYVIVTDSSVTVGSASYQLDEIRSAKWEPLMVEPLIEIARPIYENIIILMLPLMGALRYLGSTYFFLSLILFLGISGGLALVGFLIKRPSIYLLRLQIKSGTTTVHATVHEPYVRHLAYEINTARERKIQARRAANWKLT